MDVHTHARTKEVLTSPEGAVKHLHTHMLLHTVHTQQQLTHTHTQLSWTQLTHINNSHLTDTDKQTQLSLSVTHTHRHIGLSHKPTICHTALFHTHTHTHLALSAASLADPPGGPPQVNGGLSSSRGGTGAERRGEACWEQGGTFLLL